MCGIVVLHRAGTGDSVRRMLGALRHRGPDDEGVSELGEFVLGVRRLAVIDLAGGHQPVATADGRIWAVCNGEIYNHEQLRAELCADGHVFRSRCDTEVLVHGYRAWGTDGLLQRLRGMFALAVVDVAEHVCLLARDRMGEKPLYLARTANGWLAASEIKALFCHPALAPDLDEASIPESLANRFLAGDRTAFANVTRLLPGHWLRLRDGRAERGVYWDLPHPSTCAPARRAGLATEVRAKVLDAVRTRLIADVPVGALLSGGLDSSVVVAAMRTAGASPLRTYTVGFAGVSPGEDERPHARLVARHCATDHTEHVVDLDAAALLPDVVWHLDEPLGDAACLPTLLIARAARRDVTVALSGEGADELFLGYPRYTLDRLAAWVLRWPTALRRSAASAVATLGPTAVQRVARRLQAPHPDARVRSALWMSGAEPATIAALCRRPLAGWERWYVADADLPRRADLADVLVRDMRAWLVNDILLKLDKMSMAVSLEARAPFLDPLLVEYVLALPLSVRYANRGKRWLRSAFAADLPRGILRRRKHPFRPPVAQWMRGALGQQLDRLLQDRTGFTATFLAAPVARQLLDQHRHGAADHSLLLWSLLTHEVWFRRFFTRSAAA
jgi:asparagine synthase (glutamine-hydrolysing)